MNGILHHIHTILGTQCMRPNILCNLGIFGTDKLAELLKRSIAVNLMHLHIRHILLVLIAVVDIHGVALNLQRNHRARQDLLNHIAVLFDHALINLIKPLCLRQRQFLGGNGGNKKAFIQHIIDDGRRKRQCMRFDQAHRRHTLLAQISRTGALLDFVQQALVCCLVAHFRSKLTFRVVAAFVECQCDVFAAYEFARNQYLVLLFEFEVMLNSLVGVDGVNGFVVERGSVMFVDLR
mmetsp:Transcript_69780/g.110917  ORF Transcript_69780/g.110917 Transcript_69780/m.110917 type:complete len:236 (+) Transcript_69780:209-916(+)